MSDGVKLWIFILLLPFFAALGHDIWANYLIDEEKRAAVEALEIDPTAHQVSDLGYIFTTYTPEFYQGARDSIDPGTWEVFIDPVLEQYTMLVALLPLALFLVYLGIARVANLPPFANTVRVRKGTAPDILDKRSENRLKYKKR